MNPRIARHPRDLEIARGIASGGEGAFATFYERYFDTVYAFALRRSADPMAAEALTERILVAALDSLDSYRGDAPLAAWVYAIARAAPHAARPEAAGRAAPCVRMRLDAPRSGPS